jgi:peptide-methionine (S)-S-oxide reductase
MSPTPQTSQTKRTIALIVAVALTLAALGFLSLNFAHAEDATPVPAAAIDNPKAAGPAQTAVLAGGCFWGMQGVFEHVKGVKQVLSGYSGGGKSAAVYGIVSTGATGHAESIQITFDPVQISYGEILRIYFSVAHDPTEFNYQGPDHGTQYRSEIFYADAAQQKIAEAYIAQLDKSGAFTQPVVTKVEALTGFYPAESYHQDYLIHNPNSPYIVYNDLPKIANLKQLFPAQYRDKPVMVSDKNPA